MRQINFTGLMLGASFISYVTFLSIHLQQVLLMSSESAGIFLFPFSIGSAVVAKFLLPVLQERSSVKNTALIGFAFLVSGCLLLIGSLQFNSTILLMVSVFCVNAVAISILYPSITALSMSGAEKESHGLMAGLQSTAYSAGCGIGIAFIWTMIRLLNVNSDKFAVNTVMTAMIVIAVFCAAGAFMLIRINENTHSYSTRQK